MDSLVVSIKWKACSTFLLGSASLCYHVYVLRISDDRYLARFMTTREKQLSKGFNLETNDIHYSYVSYGFFELLLLSYI